MGGEGMRRGLQPHDDADRPRADLRVGRAARLAHAMDLVERLAPQLGLGVDLHQQAGERPAGQRRSGFQRLELARAEVGIDLQHAASARFMPAAMPKSSASRALSEGVKRPSLALCLVVRDVVKPMAPARSASSVRRAISSISRSFGTSSWSAPRSPMT